MKDIYMATFRRLATRDQRDRWPTALTTPWIAAHGQQRNEQRTRRRDSDNTEVYTSRETEEGDGATEGPIGPTEGL